MQTLKKADIELKTFIIGDASLLFNLVDKNRDHVGEWLPWIHKINEVSDIESKIKSWKEKQEKGEGINFGIWKENKLVGVIAFNFIHKENKKGEIGYWIDKESQGKGVMTNACRLIIDYGFRNLNLHRIEISCAKDNEKSCVIPKRLGFTKEGHLRESGYINGKFVDHYYYSLLENEWKS